MYGSICSPEWYQTPYFMGLGPWTSQKYKLCLDTSIFFFQKSDENYSRNGELCQKLLLAQTIKAYVA